MIYIKKNIVNSADKLKRANSISKLIYTTRFQIRSLWSSDQIPLVFSVPVNAGYSVSKSELYWTIGLAKSSAQLL